MGDRTWEDGERWTLGGLRSSLFAGLAELGLAELDPDRMRIHPFQLILIESPFPRLKFKMAAFPSSSFPWGRSQVFF